MSCPDCTTGGLLAGEPKGQTSILNAYFSPAPLADQDQASDNAILLLTDAFGLSVKNGKVLGDMLAERLKCDVWVPDIFEGRPLMEASSLKMPERAGEKLTWKDWAYFILGMVPRIPILYSNRPSVVSVRISKFIEEIKKDKGYKKLGVVGFCFGGSMAVHLGGSGLVDSVVICHPGRFSLDEVKAIKVPAAWVCAEDDLFFAEAKRLQCEAIFAERTGKPDYVDYEFTVYEGTTHGFAARPNLTYPEIKEAHEKAFDQTVNWFLKTVVN
ncbi:alpha/beta-hydrolase [Pluteus cervinus]|uniref:Alpha/beta-hydrolase n=1 Tax=Pluteus cervinus TaxID=181527 RepID=A0ACD3ASZ5_9AGAR|nr:alpha/beta-hydrolase [Pluteus cervinus]